MDYRMRKITFHGYTTYEIVYDDRLTQSFFGTVQDALKEANHMMDVYGFKGAEIIEDTTGEVIATIEEEEP